MKKLYLLLILLLVGCSGGGSAPPAANDFSITLAFTRIAKAGLDDIKVSAIITNNAAPASGITPLVTLSSGSLSTIVETSSGVYDFTVSPASTGEFPVTVSYAGVSKSGTTHEYRGFGQH